jgi:glycosyltransferase involved in cell wall biosynthesis
VHQSHEPLISFVVLCYNHARFVGDCLDSIFAQERKRPYEVLLVDDASSDGSQEVVLSYRDPRLRTILHPRNLGHIATLHDGIAAARGRYIARIDSDDRYRAGFLHDVIDLFHQYPQVGLVYGDAALIDERGVITAPRSDNSHRGRDFRGNEFIRLLERNFICAPTVIARRECWESVLPVPDGLAFHDYYFTLMMARQWQFYYLDRVLADYRVHNGNLHTQIARDRREEESIFWLLNHIFGQTEKEEALEQKKRRVRRRVLAAHYLEHATKYFGFRMDMDARRCYLRAIRHRPQHLLQAATVRQLLGTCVGRKCYETFKAIVKSLVRRGQRSVPPSPARPA